MSADPMSVVSRQMAKYFPEADPDEFRALGSMLRATRILQSRMDTDDAMRRYDLSFARLEILGLLYYNQDDPLPMNTISSWLMVHPASVTNSVERLVDQGYVQRVRSDADRRVVRAELTPSGKSAVEACLPRLAERRFGLSGLSAKETRQLVGLLAKVRAETPED